MVPRGGQDGGMVDEMVGSSMAIEKGDIVLLYELGRENLNFWIGKKQETCFLSK